MMVISCLARSVQLSLSNETQRSCDEQSGKNSLTFHHRAGRSTFVTLLLGQVLPRQVSRCKSKFREHFAKFALRVTFSTKILGICQPTTSLKLVFPCESLRTVVNLRKDLAEYKESSYRIPRADAVNRHCAHH